MKSEYFIFHKNYKPLDFRKRSNISKAYNGRTHDFKIRKMSEHIPKDVTILADSGYQGLQGLHPKTILLHKRKRKSKLSAEQKTHNRALSSKRVSVEHVFAQLKKFKILGSTYRNFRKNYIFDSIDLLRKSRGL